MWCLFSHNSTTPPHPTLLHPDPDFSSPAHSKSLIPNSEAAPGLSQECPSLILTSCKPSSHQGNVRDDSNQRCASHFFYIRTIVMPIGLIIRQSIHSWNVIFQSFARYFNLNQVILAKMSEEWRYVLNLFRTMIQDIIFIDCQGVSTAIKTQETFDKCS